MTKLFLRAGVSTLALGFVAVAAATASSAAVITFDEVVIGAKSFGFDGDADLVDDVIFKTTDFSGFNTAGPGGNQKYIQEPGLEGTSLLKPALTVEFLRGATESLSFGFALNSSREDESFLAGISVYDSSDKLIGFSAEVGRYASTALGTSSFPEGQVSVGFSGTASYANLFFESEFGRYIIDNFAGNFGSDAIPIQRSNGPTHTSVDSRQEEFYRNKPTVIITHGRQPTGTYSGQIDSVAFLADAYDQIDANYGDKVNILVFSWDAAFKGDEFQMPIQAAGAGVDLGVELHRLFGGQDTYDQPIHFIGHSYGTIVNAQAATFLTDLDYKVDHVTILDAPTNLPEAFPQVSTTHYTRLVANELVTYVENYYATEKLKIKFFPDMTFGEPINGTARDGGYAIKADHSSITQNYINTIPIRGFTVAEGGFYLSAALGSDGFFSFRPNKNQSVDPIATVASDLTKLLALNASFDDTSQTGVVQTGSNGYLVFETRIPEYAQLMLFDLVFDMPGDGDFLEVQFGDSVLGVFGGASFLEWTNVVLGVQEYAGLTDFLSFLLVSVGPEPASLQFSNVEFVVVQDIAAPIPAPAGLSILLGGVAFLGIIRMRQRRSANR